MDDSVVFVLLVVVVIVVGGVLFSQCSNCGRFFIMRSTKETRTGDKPGLRFHGFSITYRRHEEMRFECKKCGHSKWESIGDNDDY